MGASLGALAALHAHWQHPRLLGGLFLQSGSFFRERWDKHEAGFERFGRITRFVGYVLRSRAAPPPVPLTITVGTAEENLENNRAVAPALADARLGRALSSSSATPTTGSAGGTPSSRTCPNCCSAPGPEPHRVGRPCRARPGRKPRRPRHASVTVRHTCVRSADVGSTPSRGRVGARDQTRARQGPVRTPKRGAHAARMSRREIRLFSPAIGAEGTVLAFGHFGRPVLAFPSEQGPAWQYEERGMVGAIADLLDAGRVKLYCVASFDSESWQAQHLPLEERARRHDAYEDWIVNQVVPFIHDDSGGRTDLIVNGPSFGAYHAANFGLRRADLFPLAICFSGVYDVSRVGWGERGDSVYFHNPADYVSHLHGDHLDWLRGHANLLLVCGQGQWEDTTGALESTKAFGAQLAEKGIPHEVDLWGHDVPHDWPSWRSQLAHHLPRFCSADLRAGAARIPGAVDRPLVPRHARCSPDPAAHGPGGVRRAPGRDAARARDGRRAVGGARRPPRHGQVHRRLPTASGPRSIETVGWTSAAIVAHTTEGALTLVDGPTLRTRRVRGRAGGAALHRHAARPAVRLRV